MLFILLFLSLPTASLDFLVIGDQGGQDFFPYYTDIQVKVSKIMKQIIEISEISFILSMGDNFYENGPNSLDDVRFKETFEKIYKTNKSIPWYLLLGNHDYQNGDINVQIEYTLYSEIWNIFDVYYELLFDIPGTNGCMVQILMTDCFTFCGLKNERCNKEFLGNISEIQLDWINEKLQMYNTMNTCVYKIVCNHYPIVSPSLHGPTKFYIEYLLPILVENNVTLYLFGHDHYLMFAKEVGVTLGYILSGAGKECRHSNKFMFRKQNIGNLNYTKNTLKFYDCQNGGFVRISVNEEYLQAFFYFGSSVSIQYATGKWYRNGSYIEGESVEPTISPTNEPSKVPSMKPSNYPSLMPSIGPSPTIAPTVHPTGAPTSSPTPSPINSIICCLTKRRLGFLDECYNISKLECRGNRKCKWCNNCNRKNECANF